MNVFKFYNEDGWKQRKKISTDAILFEDLRTVAKNYVSRARKKINRYIPKKGCHFLDFASGPLQYKEYIKYSKNFKYRHCVDFSNRAIKEAKKKIGKKGKFYCNDFMKINFKKNYFDCTVSLHTIYHINKNKQEKVIKKLIYVTKKNSPIIIVYSNPNTLINKFKNLINYKKNKKGLYFYCHNKKWWYKFSKLAKIEFYPWRSFSSQHQKILFPNNIFGSFLFKLLIFFEDNFPNFFFNYFQYQIIILKKH